MKPIWSRAAVVLLIAGGCITPQMVLGQAEAPFPEGVWEADAGQLGTVGINLWSVPSSLGHGGPAESITATRAVLQVGVYNRAGAAVQCGEENFFDTGWRGRKEPGVRASFTNNVLTVTYPQLPHETAVDVNLRWHPDAATWTGRFHRGDFDKDIVMDPAPNRPNHDQSLCSRSGITAPLPRPE